MIKVIVNINGKDYTLKGRDNEKYLKQVAEYVDGKISEIATKNRFLSTGDAAVLAAVNIADDLYESDINYQNAKKDKVSLEERNQTLSDTIKELREKVDNLQKQKDSEASILQEKLESNNKDIENLNKNIETLNKEKEDLSESNRILNKEKGDLSASNEILSKEKEDLKEK